MSLVEVNLLFMIVFIYVVYIHVTLKILILDCTGTLVFYLATLGIH
jgi:hypothetical protein